MKRLRPLLPARKKNRKAYSRLGEYVTEFIVTVKPGDRIATQGNDLQLVFSRMHRQSFHQSSGSTGAPQGRRCFHMGNRELLIRQAVTCISDMTVLAPLETLLGRVIAKAHMISPGTDDDRNFYTTSAQELQFSGKLYNTEPKTAKDRDF